MINTKKNLQESNCTTNKIKHLVDDYRNKLDKWTSKLVIHEVAKRQIAEIWTEEDIVHQQDNALTWRMLTIHETIDSLNTTSEIDEQIKQNQMDSIKNAMELMIWWENISRDERIQVIKDERKEYKTLTPLGAVNKREKQNKPKSSIVQQGITTIFGNLETERFRNAINASKSKVRNEFGILEKQDILKVSETRKIEELNPYEHKIICEECDEKLKAYAHHLISKELATFEKCPKCHQLNYDFKDIYEEKEREGKLHRETHHSNESNDTRQLIPIPTIHETIEPTESDEEDIDILNIAYKNKST